MKEYLRSSNEVVRELGSSENGLSDIQAKDRLAQNGPNKLAEGKKITRYSQIFGDLYER